MSDPAQVTTPTNAVALSVYVVSAALGVLHLTGAAEALKLTQYAGTGGAAIWALMMLLGAGLAFTGAVGANPARVRSWLAVEMIGSLLLAGAFGWYLGSLIAGYGITSNLTTKTFGLALGCGCLLRFAQIGREQCKLAKALRHPRPADPAPLAGPVD